MKTNRVDVNRCVSDNSTGTLNPFASKARAFNERWTNETWDKL